MGGAALRDPCRRSCDNKRRTCAACAPLAGRSRPNRLADARGGIPHAVEISHCLHFVPCRCWPPHLSRARALQRKAEEMQLAMPMDDSESARSFFMAAASSGPGQSESTQQPPGEHELARQGGRGQSQV